jgi:hypothetical protein
VLEEVGETGFFRPLVPGTHVVQHIHGHHRGAVIFVHQYPQAIFQLETFEFYHGLFFFFLAIGPLAPHCGDALQMPKKGTFF